MKPAIKYEYCLYTWGGFYNDNHLEKHNQSEGHHFFDSKEERDQYKAELKLIEKELGANYLMCKEWEGVSSRVPTILHRVISHNGNLIYSSNEISGIRDYDSALYILQNKWYPGFNDYPLGEDFDYSTIETVEEWITGAFKLPL